MCFPRASCPKMVGKIFDTLSIDSIKKACADVRVSLLDEQYRMHPDISEVPRVHVYENKIKDGSSCHKKEANDNISGSSVLNVIDTSNENSWASQVSTGGRFNLYNAIVVAELAESIIKSSNDPEVRLGIITAYRHQANLILRIIEDKGISRDKIRISTIHTFQGAENKIVVFDLVEGYGAKKWSMLNEDDNSSAIRLVNVAITRAEAKFYVVAHTKYFKETFSSNTLVGKLIDNCEKKGKVIPSDKIVKNWEASDFDKWIDKLDETDIRDSVTSSRLFTGQEFWPQFVYDIKKALNRIIILSPFLSAQRAGKLMNLLTSLVRKGIKIFVITRPPNEQSGVMVEQAEIVIGKLTQIGVRTVFRSKMHQKVAIIDNDLAWEGSLNILSHNNTQEQMRRIVGEKTIKQIYDNLSLEELDKEHESNLQLCPECSSKGLKNYVTLKKGRFGQFYACSSFPKCKWTSSFNGKKTSQKSNVSAGVSAPRNTKTSKSQWETSICYWSLEEKPGYIYSKKKDAWYKKK